MQRKHRKQFLPTNKQSMELCLTKWQRHTLAEPAQKWSQYIVSKTQWIWLLSMSGFSTKRLPMRTFLKETLSAYWQRSWLIHKCSSKIKFQAKHHSPSAIKTTHRQTNSVRSRFYARETVLLACTLMQQIFMWNMYCISTKCL